MTTTDTTLSKDRLRLWLRLLKATRMIEGELRENLRQDFGATLPRFDVMAALSQHRDGLKMSALSGVLRVSNGNITGIVDRLTSEGFVERVPVPGDRRASLVRLTEKGSAEFDKQAFAHEAWVNDLLSVFSQDAAATLGQQLDSLVTTLSEKDM